jgi:gamma-glutamylputrescine oxidase
MQRLDLLTANDGLGTYPGSYYAAVNEKMAPFAEAIGELTCDVCVVGGGFTGLSSAIHLAEKGYDVVLLEAQRVGFGASGRNGGQVGSGQRRDQDFLETQLGKDNARKLWDIAVDAVNMVRDFCGEEMVDCPFHEGVIHAAHRKRFVSEEHLYAEKLRRDYGYDLIEDLSQSEMRDRLASPLYFGGTLDRGSGHIDPLRFALGLARKAKSLGVRIHEQSRVHAIDMSSPAIVSTDKARVSAQFLILGCNGYLGRLQKDVSARVMPINNFIVATEPLSAAKQEEIIRGNHAVADSKFVINYFRFSDDHRLLFGGTESYGYRFPKNIAASVQKPMEEVFPQLSGIGIDYAWGGTLGITVNRMPHFARLADNVLSMSGFSGHGVALATMSGKIAADTIAGQAERFDVMSKLPTMPFPGGARLRWPLLVLAMLYYSLRDKL